MISTVTASTITTITTVTLAGSFALIVVLVLLSLLIQKEVTSASTSSRLKMLSRFLYIGIIPLLIAFILIVYSRVVDVLQ